MSEKKEKLPPLEQGLLTAMRALGNQIRREVDRRTPSELEELGVRKWEAYDSRIEKICSLVLNYLGDEEVTLDSLIVMSQAMTKTLALVVDDLGREGLGKIRSDYCLAAAEGMERDARKAKYALREEAGVN